MKIAEYYLYCNEPAVIP